MFCVGVVDGTQSYRTLNVFVPYFKTHKYEHKLSKIHITRMNRYVILPRVNGMIEKKKMEKEEKKLNYKKCVHISMSF